MTLREGAGGGRRVSAATMDGAWDEADLDRATLWRVRAGEDALDAALDARGLAVKDQTRIWWASVEALAPRRPERMTGFAVWPPLAIMRDLWATGGIGPGRLAVMARAPEPRTAFLIRLSDRPAATGFAAVVGPVAALHAVEVAPALRRMGAGTLVLRHAAWWARGQGAGHLVLAVTEANAAANALYAQAGMTPGPGYHYRVRKEPP